MAEEAVLTRRRSSIDGRPDMHEEKPSFPGQRLLQESEKLETGIWRWYRRLRGTPVLGLGIRAIKGWTIAIVVASAVAMGVFVTVGTLPKEVLVAVGALVFTAVIIGTLVTRLRTRA